MVGPAAHIVVWRRIELSRNVSFLWTRIVFDWSCLRGAFALKTQSSVRVSNIKLNITGRNFAQRGFHPARNPSAGRCTVPPFWTRVSAGMKFPLGRDSSGNMSMDTHSALQGAGRATITITAEEMAGC